MIIPAGPSTSAPVAGILPANGGGAGAGATRTETERADFGAMLSALLSQAAPVAPPVAPPVRAALPSFGTPTQDADETSGEAPSATSDEAPRVMSDEALPPRERMSPSVPDERQIEMPLVERRPRTGARERIESSTEVLDPVFAQRLDRVVERMTEAGYQVTITETLRTPERQQALYAQGRSDTGPVVTWTLDSRHLSGTAADVRLHGRNESAGYALMHRVAKEEGLRTLGARDPGHLELPRPAAPGRATATSRGAQDQQHGVAGIARVAQVATVAAVGRIATVATVAAPAAVAQVARVGATGASGRAAHITSTSDALVTSTESAMRRAPQSATPSAVLSNGHVRPRSASARSVAGAIPAAIPAAIRAEGRADIPTEIPTEIPADIRADIDVPVLRSAESPAAAPATVAAAARTAHGRTVTEPATRERGIVGEIVRDAAGHSSDPEAGASRATAPTFSSLTPGAPVARVAPAGSVAAARVLELLEARDAAPPRPVTELRLAFDPSRDGLDSARLSMTGRELDASLLTRDATLGRDLRADLGTLTRSLEKHGLDAARISVESSTLAAPLRAAAESAASDTPSRERADQSASHSAARDAREQAREQARDAQRDQQRARQLGLLRPRLF